MPQDQHNEKPLQSWKEIATYLERDIRTAVRWEKRNGLPVRRHGGRSGSSVYAYPSEIEAWRAARPNQSEQGTEAPLWRRPTAWAALGVAVTAAFIIAYGPILNPPDPLAEAAEPGTVQHRQVWAEQGVDVDGSISPDGQLLSYVHWDTGDLAVRNLEAGQNRILTGKEKSWGADDQFARFPVFGPSSQRICYTWFNDEEPKAYELRTIDALAESPATTARVLYSHKEVAWPQAHAWFPDGDRVLATLTRQDSTSVLAIVSVPDGEISQLRSFEWSAITRAELSPDGRFIAYNRASEPDAADSDIFLLSVDGSSEVKIVDHPAFDDVIAWIPDGSGLIFRSDRGGSEDLWKIEIADGKAVRRAELVGRSVSIARPLGWGRSGALYYGTRAGDYDVYLAAVEFQTGEVIEEPRIAAKTYEGHNVWPSFSPDGNTMAYLSRRANYELNGELSPTLVLKSLSDRPDQEIDELPMGSFGRASWSPDGKRLLLGGTLAGGQNGIFVLDIESRETQYKVRSFFAPRNARPFWEPSGKGFYYPYFDEEASEGWLRHYDTDTGERSNLFRLKDGNAVLSPDGGSFAVTQRDRREGVYQLFVRNAKTGEQRLLIEDRKPSRVGTTVHWTPDGKRIAFWRIDHDTGEARLWSIRPDGTDLRSTELITRSVNPSNIEELTIHPDGQRVAYSTGQRRFEVWAMKGLLSSDAIDD